ncbi:MAG: right-handed parallel beta-helix repeat-containing protein, partial [Clostridia bacterium]|nr:right-handed parallel beta-helix repeat-containing protein [Clostridia bacterium]
TVHCDIATGINTYVKTIDQGEVIFENCTFENNFGIQMQLRETKAVTIKNCTFKDGENSTGHIVAGHMGVLTLEGNTFEGDCEALQQKDGIEKVIR